MTTKMTLNDARLALHTAQSRSDIFGRTAKALPYWLDKYADKRSAWFYGVLHNLESWVEEEGFYLDSTGPIDSIDYKSPEMATAVGDFVEDMLG